MPDNTTFKVFPNQPVRYSSVVVLNSMHDPVYYHPYSDLDFNTQVSGQFTEFPGPKSPDNILAAFDADDANLPSSNNAALVNVNDYDFLAFDSASVETAYFDGVTPENYTGKDIMLRIGWTSETGITGNVLWRASLAHLTGANNLYNTTYLDPVSGVDAAPSASGSPQEVYLQMSADNLGNLSKVEDYRIKIDRVGNNASDTMPGDAYLLSIGLEELY